MEEPDKVREERPRWLGVTVRVKEDLLDVVPVLLEPVKVYLLISVSNCSQVVEG